MALRTASTKHKKAARAETVAADETAVPQEGNLTRIVKADYLSLVGHPANQRGFRIVRSAGPVATPLPDQPAKRVISRNASKNPVIAITFPESYDEAQAEAVMEKFGLSGYNIGPTSDDDAKMRAIRSDLKSISNEGTSTIRLSDDGIMAVIEGENVGTPGERKTGVSVVRYEFTTDSYDEAAVRAWFEKNQVDFSGTVVENPDQSMLVCEVKPVEEATEVRRLECDGAVFVIVRDDASNIPAGYVEAVNEAAYGGWGWGQLDFAANLMDSTVSESLDDACCIIQSTFRNILFWSNLPIDSRKQLIARAAQQFSDYVGNMLDYLPRQVLQMASRAESPSTSEETSMTTTTTGGTNGNTTTTTTGSPAATTAATATGPGVDSAAAAAANAGDPAAKTAEQVAAAEAAEKDKPVTRGELNDAIAAGVTAAMKGMGFVGPAAVAEEAQRAQRAAEAEANKPITRTELNAAIEGVTEKVVAGIKKEEGKTIIRSQDTDQQPVEKDGSKTKPVFRGVLGGLGQRAAPAAKQ